MSIPADKLRAFLDAEYRVRLPQGGCTVIRIGEPLPRALHPLLRDEHEPWGFITAWNPFARRVSRESNRATQRELLAALRERHAGVRPALGKSVSADQGRWREPSLFVIGLDFDALDELGRRFEQAAIVRGRGCGIAELRALL